MKRFISSSPSQRDRQVFLTGTTLGAAILGFNMVMLTPTHAAIYKCISDKGAVTYSGRKCPETDTTAKIIADSGHGSADKRKAPAAATPAPEPAAAEKRVRDTELNLPPYAMRNQTGSP